MSYSRSYSESVSFSGSVPYSYPASEHGGSGNAHYSGSVPVHVTINVNTQPFDGSVNRFKNSVDILTSSVVAMKTAQCAAIMKTATEVSSSIIKGFFNAVNTELSQQIQSLNSAMEAGMGLLLEQGKAVVDKRSVMEIDFNRISSRYIRLFDDLDNECYKRIYALDKQSFSLSEKVQKELVSETASNAAAMNLLGIEEVSSSKTIVFVSSLNRKALDVMRTLHDYITQESGINALVNSFLFNEEIGENTPLSVPVIWMESDTTEGNGVSQESIIPGYIDQLGKQAIAKKVNMFCCGSSAWKGIGEVEKKSLNKEFNLLAESFFGNATGETEQRIYKTMLSLWQNTQLFSLYKEKF